MPQPAAMAPAAAPEPKHTQKEKQQLYTSQNNTPFEPGCSWWCQTARLSVNLWVTAKVCLTPGSIVTCFCMRCVTCCCKLCSEASFQAWPVQPGATCTTQPAPAQMIHLPHRSHPPHDTYKHQHNHTRSNSNQTQEANRHAGALPQANTTCIMAASFLLRAVLLKQLALAGGHHTVLRCQLLLIMLQPHV